MKKLIGIILAICMLSTMAFAAEVTDVDADTMTVTFTYTKLTADGAQSTMLAYQVDDKATADDLDTLDYIDEDTTPIKAIDQEASDGSFTFKLASDFEGKLVIKVGGTGVEADDVEAIFFADFAKEEGVKLTLAYGDVNGDGNVTSADASLILQKAATIISVFVDKAGREIPEVVADVNGDSNVTSADASLILQKAATIITDFVDKAGNKLVEYTYTYVAPAE